MLASVLASLTAPGPVSGSSSPQPFAFFDPVSLSWRTSQVSLLPDSESSWPTWPKRGMTHGGRAFELPTSVLHTAASESSSLLPTPSAVQNDGHDPEKFLARRERELAKGRNGNGFGLTLGMAAALLPTPGANDHTGAEAREAREAREAGGASLRDLPTLLPTPTARDDRGPNTNAREGGMDLPSAARLLPTPTSQAAKHGSTEDVTADGHGHNLWDLPHLLPTPVANPENPGTGGELRAALTHGPDRRNETGTDTMGRPNQGRPSRLLPTPQAADGDRSSHLQKRGNPTLLGASTNPPSGDGSISAGEPLLGQLTIEDASALSSSNGCSDSPADGLTA